MSKPKTIPTRSVMEHINDEGDGLLILTDMKKAKKTKDGVEKVQAFGVENKIAYEEFLSKTKELSDKLNANVKVKVFVILNE